MSRTVTLVLVDGAGALLGALPPFDLPFPFWPQVSDVVAEASRRYAVDVTVLRLLTAERPAMPGGRVTYLAQVDDPPAAGARPAGPAGVELDPADVDLAAHPLRAPWAVPGGPQRSVAWASAALARLGGPAVRARQQKTWNLSAIWRLDPLDDAGDPVWLKQVPGFFHQEVPVLRWLNQTLPGLAPSLLADDGDGRMLLAHVPGEDWYETDLAGRRVIAGLQHRVQVRAVPDVDALVAAGVPDRRGPRLVTAIRSALAGHQPAVHRVLPDLAGRMAELARCGLPDTLVHGDLHPGNVRSDVSRQVVIDWGDAFVGHPGFDILRLTENLDPAAAAALTGHWCDLWRSSRPGCDPERAVELLRPVAALRLAAVYADFLANIEPSEHPYHAQDVPAWLAVAAETAGSAPPDASPGH